MRLWFAVLTSVLAAYGAHAAEFEVASLKRVEAPTGPHSVSLNVNHEKLTIEAATLRQMIGLAWGIQRVRVLDGPEWTDSEEYDVVAKAASPSVTRDEIRAMLQTLLTERFQLGLRRENQEQTEYRLTLGKSGSKLKAAADDEAGEFTPSPRPGGGWRLVFKKRNLVGLVNTLANFLGAPVRDETGLTGQYDFEIAWQTVWEAASPPATPGGPEPSDSGPTLFQAVEQQLGLRLVKSKGLQDVLIIERAGRAKEN